MFKPLLLVLTALSMPVLASHAPVPATHKTPIVKKGPQWTIDVGMASRDKLKTPLSKDSFNYFVGVAYTENKFLYAKGKITRLPKDLFGFHVAQGIDTTFSNLTPFGELYYDRTPGEKKADGKRSYVETLGYSAGAHYALNESVTLTGQMNDFAKENRSFEVGAAFKVSSAVSLWTTLKDTLPVKDAEFEVGLGYSF